MKRLSSIDFLRGLVMLLMTIDHTRDMFSTVNIGEHLGTTLPLFYFITRWITHFCAPTFVFLSGISIALWMKKYKTTLYDARWHVIKRGAFIAFLDISFASILWTLIDGQPIFTIYLAELWAIGCGMILLGCLLNFSARTIFLIGVLIIGSHNLFENIMGTSVISTILNGNGSFLLIPNLCQVVSNYAVLPWFGIVCVGYAVGHYLSSTKSSTLKQTQLFLFCAFASIGLFIILRTFNIYGDMNYFVYHPGNFLLTLYSYFDVTKYPPSLQYTLITLLLSWFTLAFNQQIERRSQSMIVSVVSHFGQTALFYYLLHLTLICIFYFTLHKVLPQSQIKTSNLFIVYGLTIIVAATAYPILTLFKKLRDKYRADYPLLGYV